MRWLFLVLVFVGCSTVAPKGWYEFEKGINTSDITITKIINSDDIKEKKIVLNSDIDARVAKEVSLKLNYLDGRVGEINFYITTRGGWLSDAFLIVDAINSIKTPVNVYVKDYCRSAGVIVLLGASGKRVALKKSSIILHFNRNYNSNNITSLKNTKRFEKIYREKTKIPSSWYPLSGNRIIELNPEEAKKLGIVDEII